MIKIKRYLTLFFISCLGLMQTGCGGTVNDGYYTESYIDYDSGFAVNSMAYEDGYTMSAGAPQKSGTTVNTVSEQKLIRTVNLTIELETSDLLNSAANDLISLARTHNGYSTYSNIDLDTRYASGSITVKIPKDDVDSFLSDVSEKGYNVKSTTDNYHDVTMEYTDVQSRLSVKLKARERYEKILENAETVEEIISVQTKLDDITEDIESFQARMNVMDNKIDFTEVSIYINCKTSVDRESFWERAKSRIGDIFYEAGDNFINGFEWLINATIFLVFAVPVAFILIKIFLVAIGKKHVAFKWPLKKVKKRNDGQVIDDGQM